MQSPAKAPADTQIDPAPKLRTLNSSDFHQPATMCIKLLAGDYVGSRSKFQALYGDLVHLRGFGG